MATPMLHPMNVATIYTAEKGRLPWTTAQLRPYVVHSYQDTTKPDTWFFDTFLLIDFYIRRNVNNSSINVAASSGYRKWIIETIQVEGEEQEREREVVKPALQSDWLNLIDSYFGNSGSNDSILKRLDDCIGQVIQEIGQPSFKHRVILSFPDPISCYVIDRHGYRIFDPTDPHSYRWNDVDGTNDMRFIRYHNQNGGLDLATDCSDCSNALKWFVDECISRWNSAQFQHLELAGFHAVDENAPGRYVAFDTYHSLQAYLQTVGENNNMDLKLSVSLYHKRYKNLWIYNGSSQRYKDLCHAFSRVFAQPNYATNSYGYDGLMEIINLATTEGDGVVVEMTNKCIYSVNANLFSRVEEYLDALQGKDDMNLLFYTANGNLAYAYDPATPMVVNSQVVVFQSEDYALYDLMAQFVRSRRQAYVHSRADINQDGVVDIADAQIVLNVMLGLDTEHATSADINGDGIVDINDFNIVQKVMLGDID